MLRRLDRLPAFGNDGGGAVLALPTDSGVPVLRLSGGGMLAKV